MSETEGRKPIRLMRAASPAKSFHQNWLQPKWRPIGFVRPASVAPQDWLPIKLVYPDRIGEIMGLVAHDAHDWIYQPKMTPDEVAYFNIYDNNGLPSIAHCALDRAGDSAVQTPRMSVESRTLVKY